MLEALCDPLFYPLLDHAASQSQSQSQVQRSTSTETVSSAGGGSLSGRSSPRGFARKGTPAAIYSHYFRSTFDGGVDALPLV